MVMRCGYALGFLFVSGSTLAWAQQYVISTIAPAASPRPPITGTRAFVNAPDSVATDGNGDGYFSSRSGVFKIDQNGVVRGVAAVFEGEGFSGDGGPAMKAQLNGPAGIAL